MKQGTPSGFSSRGASMRNLAMNVALMALLTGLFLWSVAGNAIENIRSAIEKRT
jgi:hypothetical protein